MSTREYSGLLGGTRGVLGGNRGGLDGYSEGDSTGTRRVLGTTRGYSRGTRDYSTGTRGYSGLLGGTRGYSRGTGGGCARPPRCVTTRCGGRSAHWRVRTDRQGMEAEIYGREAHALRAARYMGSSEILDMYVCICTKTERDEDIDICGPR